MMTDYAPIASPDEEELQKLQLSPYPAIGSPGPALLTLPAAGTPSAREGASGQNGRAGNDELAIAPAAAGALSPDEVNLVGGAQSVPLSSRMPQLRQPAVRPVAPTASDYSAVEPHGWRKALAILGPSLMAAGGNTRGALAMQQQLFQAPKERLDTQYQQEMKQYDTEQQQEERERQQSDLEKLQQSEIGKNEAAAKAAGAPKNPWKVIAGVIGKNGELYQENADTGDVRIAPGIAGAQSLHPTAPNQEANKRAFQDVVSKLDAAHLATDPKHLDASLDAALMRGVISQQEHGQARGYESANPTPGTNLTVHIAGQEAAEGIRQRDKYYLSNGKMVRGDQLSADEAADAVPIKDPQQFKAGATVANTVARSFNHLADDDLKIFDDPKARVVLATALNDDEAKRLGLLVAGTGGEITLPSGSGKIIDQLLENHAVPQNLRREVKNYVVDYWAMRDKLLAMQMEMQGGKIGRGNAVFFNAMLAQLPGGGTSDSVMARRQMNALSETMRGLKEQYGDLADIEPKRLEGDTGEPRTGGGAKLSPAGQQYLNSILGH